MKKLLCMILVLCLCIPLAACGFEKQPEAPSESLLEQDLQEEITSYKEFLTLKSFEVEQSLTEESNYTATIAVVAESTYAEYQLSADVSYTKYDQGWDMDTCDLEEKEYSVVRYPSSDDVMEWIVSGEATSDESWCSQTFVDMTENGDTIELSGVYEENMGSYITAENDVISTWEYYSDEDTWKYRGDDVTSTIKLKDDIEGKYSLKGGGEIIISNVSEDGFDVCATAYNTNVVHVEYSETWNQIYYYSGTGLSYSYGFHEETNSRVVVYFSGSEDHLRIGFIIDASGTSSLSDFADIAY